MQKVDKCSERLLWCMLQHSYAQSLFLILVDHTAQLRCVVVTSKSCVVYLHVMVLGKNYRYSCKLLKLQVTVFLCTECKHPMISLLAILNPCILSLI